MSAVATAPKTEAAVVLKPDPAPARITLWDISWDQYTKLNETLINQPRLRLTYDRGVLELMTTSPLHEVCKKRLGRLVETLAEVHGLEYAPGGQMTMHREDLDKGLEGDECYWIAHELQMRAKSAWVARNDPPPDLVIEIEISRSALNKMSLYAALGVPEVWRFDGQSLRVEVLQPNGKFRPSERSPTFPAIPLEGLLPFMQLDQSRSYSGMLDEFRDWVRQQLAAQG